MANARSGHIIGITSIRGLPHCGRESILGYSAAKAAVISMIGVLAKELAPNVQVNGVAPGLGNVVLSRRCFG